MNIYKKEDNSEFKRSKIGIYEILDNKNILLDDEEIVYHVSLDIDNKDKLFTPLVPKHRCKGEDDKIKRISVARNLKDAISGFPSKDFFVNTYKRSNRYLTVYEFKVKKKDLIMSEDLTEYVPDVHLTNECWLMKESIGKARVISVKDITLKGYNSYANYYHGVVNKLEYEESISDKETEVCTVTTNKEEFNELLAYINENNLKYEILMQGKNKFYLYDLGYLIGTTDDEYEWSSIRIKVPKGFCRSDLWKIVSKIDRGYISIGASHLRIDNSADEDERLECNIEYILDNLESDKKINIISDKNDLILNIKNRTIDMYGYDYSFEDLENIILEIA